MSGSSCPSSHILKEAVTYSTNTAEVVCQGCRPTCAVPVDGDFHSNNLAAA